MPKLLSIPFVSPASPRTSAARFIRRYSSSTIPAAPSPLQRTQSQVQSPASPSLPRRSLARLRSERETSSQLLWFTAAQPTLMSRSDARSLDGKSERVKNHKPVDERIVKLGKTLRILTEQLPTLLVNPLPQEILSPNITLHLFPSTHPHLPTVKGRVAYRAALWTAPVAWGSVPIVGNVRLQIMSERMVRGGAMSDFNGENNSGDEKLVVRWMTEGGASNSSSNSGNKAGSGNSASDGSKGEIKGTGNSATSASSASNGTNRGLSVLLGGEAPIFKLGKEEQFTGLFIFSFDEEGRIATHTIEHADENSGWDRTAKVVTLTDWLLGKAKWGSREPSNAAPALAVETPMGMCDKLRFRDGPQEFPKDRAPSECATCYDKRCWST
ncbi:uncharacterized protein CIMG_02481 [Coccidioides immitis RS]|uniref:Chromosome transmission fidelity protein 4 n=3 Tax=Coccidioides immitis TaxID=5501 RepID=A0A0E1S5L4_COCIM|nr:uncharacterized protein CIMG_02481 [Coccidioides immitis RS]EAS37127.1 hypothetical protein CIMG_02481 [Coccidioides immitis RS]KMP10069.1 hypothetical protein CIRG_09302 [Coccidioides immitis RMSCC 2394]KMU80127.1 hypothetical protein CISG_08469 [Coccidioides immitis RMSCC 3703]TPX24860.1 hypothetical protein DIZ76_010304 [Coccidioides immitis]